MNFKKINDVTMVVAALCVILNVGVIITQLELGNRAAAEEALFWAIMCAGSVVMLWLYSERDDGQR